MLYQPGVLSIAWGTAIRQLAAGLGIEVDEISDSVEQEPAPEDFDVAVGTIKKGTVAAVRFQIEGMVKGKPVIVVEHVTRLRRRSATRLGATRASRRLIPRRDHRRAVVCHGHLPDEPQRRPQLRGHPRGGRPDRERHPRRCRRAAPASGPRSICRSSQGRVCTQLRRLERDDARSRMQRSDRGDRRKHDRARRSGRSSISTARWWTDSPPPRTPATASAAGKRGSARCSASSRPSMRYRLGRMRFEHLLARAAGYLRGESLAELDELGERLFADRVASRVFPHMREIVRAHQQRGHTVVLSSSALTIHAEPVARFLGIEPRAVQPVRARRRRAASPGRIAKPVVWGGRRRPRCSSSAGPMTLTCTQLLLCRRRRGRRADVGGGPPPAGEPAARAGRDWPPSTAGRCCGCAAPTEPAADRCAEPPVSGWRYCGP